MQIVGLNTENHWLENHWLENHWYKINGQGWLENHWSKNRWQEIVGHKINGYKSLVKTQLVIKPINRWSCKVRIIGY